jgi:hypothetical protein
MDRILGSVCFALGVALLAAPAVAAPQILGVVAGTVPLNCDGTGCRAEASTFCLQQARSIPAPGTGYASARAGDMTLVVTTVSGETLRLPAGGRLDLRSARGHSAVSMTLQRATMDALGARQVTVEIAPDASLLPVAEAGDPNPQTAEDVALATGPMRQTATAFFEGPDPRAKALRLAGIVVNALPEEGRTPLDRDGDASGSLLQRAIAAAPEAATPEAVALLADLHAECRFSVTEGFKFSLRRCYEAAHDRLTWGLNLDLWKSTGGY